MSGYGLALLDQHAAMLAASGITPEHARARGYVSVDTRKRLEGLGITRAGRNVPGLLVPQLRVDGSVWGYQYRPDVPRLRDGKPVKYETPVGQRNGIDVPPGVGPQLADPSVPLWITEGVKKADAGALAGLAIVALPGVWSWRGTSDRGGKVAVPDWHDVALNGRRVVLAFDSDVVVKRSVRAALDALAAYLAGKGADVEYLHLPDDDDAKTGLDDYLAAGHDVAGLWRLVRPDAPAVALDPAPVEQAVALASVARRTVETDVLTLLAEVRDFIGDYVAFPSEHELAAVVLWVVHAHAVDSFESTPRLAALSPEPSSGKTRLLECLEVLCPRPMHVLSASPAAIFRSIEVEKPTLLMDEVDALFGRKGKNDNAEDLRGLLNAGHRSGATIPRCVGKSFEVKQFPVYCAVALAGLGDLPDTLMSRSVVLRMRRRAPGESVRSFRRREVDALGEPLRQRLSQWADVNADALACARPVMPAGVHDRPADVWEPLLAVADLAGGHWPDLARAACRELVKVVENREASLGVRLLADLREVFGDQDGMHTETIIERLCTLDEAPWGDLYGKPVDSRRISRILGGYGIKSVQVWADGSNGRGYKRADLWDAWRRYLTPTAEALEVLGALEHDDRPADAAPSSPNTPNASAPPMAYLSPCPHDVLDGEQPDPFVGGRARCPQCRAEQIGAAS